MSKRYHVKTGMIEKKQIQIELPELKTKTPDLKSTLGGIICRLDSTRENDSEIDNIVIQTLQMKHIKYQTKTAAITTTTKLNG